MLCTYMWTMLHFILKIFVIFAISISTLKIIMKAFIEATCPASSWFLLWLSASFVLLNCSWFFTIYACTSHILLPGSNKELGVMAVVLCTFFSTDCGCFSSYPCLVLKGQGFVPVLPFANTWHSSLGFGLLLCIFTRCSDLCISLQIVHFDFQPHVQVFTR